MYAKCWSVRISTEPNGISIPPGKYSRKTETQKDRRGTYKQWIISINWMINQESYPGLTSLGFHRDMEVPSLLGAKRQVLHGRRQLVPQGVRLIPITSEPLYLVRNV